MNRYELDDPEKMELFIQIYQELCKETIQFDRSMARPLVLNACYFKSNKWKDACEMFIKCFSHNISWQSVKATKSVKVNGKTTYEYIRDDNRYITYISFSYLFHIFFRCYPFLLLIHYSYSDPNNFMTNLRKF